MSGILQFFILPFLLKQVNPKYIWLFMPSVILCFTTFQNISGNPSLLFVASTFSCMKILEYSLRNAVTEILYSSLDFKSRFVGKEIISMLANRIGKSGMAIGLSIVTYLKGNDENLGHYFRMLANLVVFLWLMTTVWLIHIIESNKEKKL
jgi:ATP/ADP translocase